MMKHRTDSEGSNQSVPLVSVVVPAYNAEETVLQTIHSIRGQTFTNFEILVIDDGSTDNTVARLQTIRDSRLQIFSYPHEGLAAVRNRGIEKSLGEFISFIDADDLWTPDKLELQVQALRERPDAAIAYSWTAFIDHKARFLFAKERSRLEGDVYPELLRHCFIASGSNVLVRRRCAVALGGFDTGIPSAQDWDFCLRVAERWPFAVVPRYQILYRISQSTMSANAERAEQGCLRVCDTAFSRTAVPPRKRKESLSNVKQYVAFLYLSRTADLDFHRKAGRKLAECVRVYPRTLLTRKTWNLFLTWALLHFIPPGMRRRAVQNLLRVYGRWLMFWRREIRELAKGLVSSEAVRAVDTPASDSSPGAASATGSA
jgi:glycosyltransferase involved in cell wall biosynthesis